MKLKKRKGMTLLECMVAMAISAVIASLLVEIMTAVNATMRKTVTMNKRLSHEAKYADNLVTADESGPFANKAGDVKITFGSTTINAGGVSYKTHYKDPKTGTYANDSANYRFMSFEKTPATTPHPANVFWVRIVLSADIDQITQIDIDGICYSHLLDPSTTDYTTQATVTTDTITSTDAMIDLSLRKTSGVTLIDIPVPSANPTGSLTVKLHKDMTDSLGGSHPNYVFETVDLDYCTQVAKPSGVMQYYTESVYAFDGVDFSIQS